MNIIKGVIALVIGMVLAIVDRSSTRATTGSAANIGSFAGSISYLLPPPSNLEWARQKERHLRQEAAEKQKAAERLLLLITPESAAKTLKVEPRVIWMLVKEKNLHTTKINGRTMICATISREDDNG